ncbi:MAG: S8 family serine peptidase [Archaeoglobaceae archaeon]
MVERLSKHLLKELYRAPIVPVIVEAKENKLMDLVEELKEYKIVEPFEVARLVQRIIPINVEVPIYKSFVIKRFNMYSAILPREVVEMYAEDSRVEKIYFDDVKYVTGFPVVSSEGIYTLTNPKTNKKIEFTSTYWTKKAIGCDVANKKGYIGRGVNVAVLDTGASDIHEQLYKRIETKSVYYMQRFDSNGHGTWCCSCIVGMLSQDDVASGLTGKPVMCEGMAPECNLLSVKVLGYVIGAGSDSAVIKGLEEAMEWGAKIVSMSLGGSVRNDNQEDDPYYPVFEKMVSDGIIPVVAAGNEGPEEGTIATPGWLENALTVGAYDPITGEVAVYSSRGPTPDGRIKPDVVAPGGGYPDHGIHSAIVNLLDCAGDGILHNRYSPIQGTSMATPHVSGLLACAEEMYRSLLDSSLTVKEVKTMMQSLGEEKTNDYGWGAITWYMFEEWISTQYGVEA